MGHFCVLMWLCFFRCLLGHVECSYRDFSMSLSTNSIFLVLFYGLLFSSLWAIFSCFFTSWYFVLDARTCDSAFGGCGLIVSLNILGLYSRMQVSYLETAWSFGMLLFHLVDSTRAVFGPLLSLCDWNCSLLSVSGVRKPVHAAWWGHKLLPPLCEFQASHSPMLSGGSSRRGQFLTGVSDPIQQKTERRAPAGLCSPPQPPYILPFYL